VIAAYIEHYHDRPHSRLDYRRVSLRLSVTLLARSLVEL
jgi:hypothetical protein